MKKVIFTALAAAMAATASINAQTSQRYYWVGGGADNNWGNISNWSNTSGGAASMGITQAPANVNTCVFDANSFINGDSTILIDGAVQCDSLLFLNPTHKARLNFQGNSSSLSINGSLELQTGMSFNYPYPQINFNSNRANESIKTNDVAFSSGVPYQATFNGNATYTLLDSAKLYNVTINNGTLNTNGKYVVVSSQINIQNTGHINFANSLIELEPWCCGNQWQNYSSNTITALQSANSTLKFTDNANNTGKLKANVGDIYNNVEIATGIISNYWNNAGIYNKITYFGNGAVYNIVADTLLLNDISEFTFYGNSTINEFLQGKPSAACGGQWKLNGSDAGQVTLAAGAVVDIERALIKDLGFSRSVTAAISVDLGNNTNIVFTAPAVSKTLYWVGNTGNWNNPMNWALSSGGAPANCVPTSFDNVVFDNASFSAPNQIVTVDLSAYCDSMSWVGNASLQPSLSFAANTTLEIYGSLEFQEGMALSGTINFNSNRANESIRSNGFGFGTSYPYNNSYTATFNGSATYTLLDSAKFSSITINDGTLNTNGQYVYSTYIIIQGTGNANIANSVIEVNYEWHNGWQNYSSNTITATQTANSLIRFLNINCPTCVKLMANYGDIYNNVEITTGIIFNGTYNKITYNGTGGVQNITADTLLINDISEFTFYGNSTINEFLQGEPSAACGGQWKLNGTGGTERVTLATGAVVDIERSLIKDLGFSRSVTAAISVDLGNNTNIIFTAPAVSKTLYWVGNTGNWNNPMNWALSSGGAPANCVPTSFDNVKFDDNSFSAPNQIVTIDLSAFCDTMSWVGNAALQPRFTFANGTTLEIYGSLEFQRGMQFYSSGYQINFNSNRPNESIKTNGVGFTYGYGIYQATFNGSATYTLLDSARFYSVTINNGTLNTNGNNVKSLTITIQNTGHIHFANSLIELEPWCCSTQWQNYSNNAITAANSANSLIKFTYNENYDKIWAHSADIYNNIEVAAGTINNGTYNKIILLGNSTLNNISETDTLVLSAAAANTYSFNGIVKINEAAYISGIPCQFIYLQSGSETTPAIFDIKTAAANFGDTLVIDNAYIHGITALTNADNAKLVKNSHCPDVNQAGNSWGYGIGTGNNNTGWAEMLPYVSGRTSNWAHDFYVPCTAFNIILTSDNMLPTYGATFEWRKDNLNTAPIATTPTLNVTDSATYFLTVNYGNGCTATDNVSVIITSSYIDSTRFVGEICPGSRYTQHNFNENTEGVFYQRLQGQFGCDSIVELTLTFTDLLKDTIRTAICQGSGYFFNGQNRTTAGTYNKMEQTAFGCDSLTTLILSVNEILTGTINAVICEGNAYTENGFNASTEGTFYNTIQNAAGCDSLITLNLTFGNRSTELYKTICEGESEVFGDTVLNTTGVYIQRKQSVSGCDSIIQMQLTVNSKLNFVLAQQVPTICADDAEFIIPLENKNINSQPTTYILKYGNKEIAGGFSNTGEQTFVSNSVSVALPTALRPDNYMVEIELIDGTNHCSNSKISVPITVHYPSYLIEQNWGDVIALLNPHTITGLSQTGHTFNMADYTFSSYQWYKNSLPIPNETRSYIYIKDGLEIGAKYMLEVKRTSDGVILFTCPIEAKPYSDIYSTPIIVQNGGIISISAIADGYVKIYTATGILVCEGRISGGELQMPAPTATGVYIINVQYDNGEIWSGKVVV